MLKPVDPVNKSGHPLSGISNGDTGSLWLDAAHNWVVLYTVASVIVATAIAQPVLTPLIHTAAILPLYYAAMRRHLHRLTVTIVVRWAAVLALSILTVGAFVPSRMAASILFSGSVITRMELWLAGSGGPPADFAYLLWGLIAFLAGAAVSGGMAGLLIIAVSIAMTACGALFLLEHGSNILSVGLMAVTPWQWLLFASAALLLVPAARPAFDRFFKPHRVMEGPEILRRYMLVGGSLFVLSVILRLSLAGLWQSALRQLTIF